MKVRLAAEFVAPIVIGLLYAGTGGWTAERWNTALGIMGMSVMAKAGYEKGYNTYNPNLRRQQQRGPDGRFLSTSDRPDEP